MSKRRLEAPGSNRAALRSIAVLWLLVFAPATGCSNGATSVSGPESPRGGGGSAAGSPGLASGAAGAPAGGLVNGSGGPSQGGFAGGGTSSGAGVSGQATGGVSAAGSGAAGGGADAGGVAGGGGAAGGVSAGGVAGSGGASTGVSVGGAHSWVLACAPDATRAECCAHYCSCMMSNCEATAPVNCLEACTAPDNHWNLKCRVEQCFEALNPNHPEDKASHCGHAVEKPPKCQGIIP